MIRRVVEYMLACDALAVLGEECPYGWEAFGSPTLAAAAESALKYKWRQISKRLWLCPKCAKEATEQRVQTIGAREMICLLNS